MIRNLYIQNFVLIEKLALDFNEGFSAFTGETGAGKSILIDAISLLCGERASASVVAQGSEKAIIEGTFDLSNDLHAMHTLEQAGFTCEGDVTFTREITKTGKSTVRIDHRIAPLSLLKEVVKNQIDIHGQRDNSYLLNTANHLRLLDGFLKDQDAYEKTENSYRIYHNLMEEKHRLEHETFNQDDLEFYRYQINEIESAQLEIGEDEILEEKEKRYDLLKDSYEKINEIFNLYQQHVSDHLYEMNRLIGSLKDDAIGQIAQTINDCYYSLDDAISSLSDIKEEMNLSEDEINQMEERLFTINRLKRKYGNTIEAVLQKKDELQQLVDSFENRQEYLEAVDRKIAKARAAYDTCALELSKIRKENSHLLDEAVQAQLKDLLLVNARFKTVFTEETVPTAHGCETCEFHISMNKGESVKPLSKTASGGELSRLMLGLKVIFTHLMGIETVIFDEIDTGVSGPVATAIGQKMKSLSETCQVFSVTHLGQVAACADTNYFVSKADDGSSTHSTVIQLDEEGIIRQLALISSGVISDSSLLAAKELYERNHG